MKPLVKACVDTSVWPSGLVFSGVPVNGNAGQLIDLARKTMFMAGHR